MKLRSGAYFLLLAVSLLAGVTGIHSLNQPLAGQSAFWSSWIVCVALVLFWPALLIAGLLTMAGFDPDSYAMLLFYALLCPLINMILYRYAKRFLQGCQRRYGQPQAKQMPNKSAMEKPDPAAS